MSAPPNDGYGQFPGHQQQQFEQQDGVPAAPAPDKKKKRGYAAQAFDVGSGANAGHMPPIGGQQFGIPPAPQQPQAYGSYPQADSQQPASPGFQYPQGYGVPQPAAQQQSGPYGSYPGPEQGYPPPGAAAQPGVSGITQGMGGMQLGGQQQQLPMGAQVPRAGPLNHLHPTDLMNQPFSVSELDLPPPPVVLPPNVSLPLATPADNYSADTKLSRPV